MCFEPKVNLWVKMFTPYLDRHCPSSEMLKCLWWINTIAKLSGGSAKTEKKFYTSGTLDLITVDCVLSQRWIFESNWVCQAQLPTSLLILLFGRFWSMTWTTKNAFIVKCNEWPLPQNFLFWRFEIFSRKLVRFSTFIQILIWYWALS